MRAKAEAWLLLDPESRPLSQLPREIIDVGPLTPASGSLLNPSDRH